MAVSGGCVSSYTYRLLDGAVTLVHSGPVLRSECMEPRTAAAKLRQGERVTVAGSDAHAFRLLVTGKNERGEVVR